MPLRIFLSNFLNDQSSIAGDETFLSLFIQFHIDFQGDLKQKQREQEQLEEEDFGNSTFGHIRTWLWNTMEYPWTSNLAQVRGDIYGVCLIQMVSM